MFRSDISYNREKERDELALHMFIFEKVNFVIKCKKII